MTKKAVNYCETCRWWDNYHPRLQHMPDVAGIQIAGFCRKHKPGAYAVKEGAVTYWIGIQPIMDSRDYCAEHRTGEA